MGTLIPPAGIGREWLPAAVCPWELSLGRHQRKLPISPPTRLISGVKSTCTGRSQRQTGRSEVSEVWEGLNTVWNQSIVMEALSYKAGF